MVSSCEDSMNETYPIRETPIRSYHLFQGISKAASIDKKDYSAVVLEVSEMISDGYRYLAADYTLGSVSSWWVYLLKPRRMKAVWYEGAMGEAKRLTDETCKVLSKIFSGHPWFELYLIDPDAFQQGVHEGFEL